jgi:transposase InsO family protein
VLELRRQYAIDGLLEMAGLARSTFYYQRQRVQIADRHARLKLQIFEIFHRHKGRYGYRRITAALCRSGSCVNHKTVQRLMRLLQIKSVVRPKKYKSYKGQFGHVAPNVLNRQFNASSPNQKWVTDVTEFNVAGEKLYLSPVMDLYNREIIAYEVAKKSTQLVDQMLHKAVGKLKPTDKPLLHSDQGWQYQMQFYQRKLNHHGLLQSMSRKGNCLDNAAMESFFATLKTEFYHLNTFRSANDLQRGIDEYIHYYNHDRISLKLKGLSPVKYRTQPLSTS